MRILHVNVCAKYGSTGKIVTDISNVLIEFGHSVLICYGANETIKGEIYYRFCNEFIRGINAICSRMTGVMYGKYPSFSTRKLIRKIEDFEPDVVHLHCINGYIVDVFKLLSYLANENIKTVLTLHAEFMYTATCPHAYDCEKWSKEGCHDCNRSKRIAKSVFDSSKKSWNMMRQSFDKFDSEKLIITSVSPWLMGRAMRSPFLKRFRHYTVFNGLNNSIFSFKENANPIFANNCLKDYCLYVTASFSADVDDNKGGHFVIELARKLPMIKFVVASNYNKCTESLPSNIILLGKICDSTKLAELYQRARLTIITSQRETFSMVTAESLCCGTPVVGFEAGGPESITLSEYSEFVEYGDIKQLYSAIVSFLSQKWNKREIAEKAYSRFSRTVMTAEYMNIYNKLLE